MVQGKEGVARNLRGVTTEGQGAGRRYFSVRLKFLMAQTVAFLWASLSVFFAIPWMSRISQTVGWPVTIFAVLGIAIIPGYNVILLFCSLLIDKRPSIREPETYPPISILVAAYNEEAGVEDTINSIISQNYPGEYEVLIIDDGSTDSTADILTGIVDPHVRPLILPRNGGKAAALNAGLAEARYDILITVDADTYLYRDALEIIVGRLLSDPPNTAAVAGAIGVRNSRTNLITKFQEWDYFHGLAVVKRVQSLYQGTLVAPGAFSLYRRDVVKALGGWPICVGEDIVLSWAMLRRQYRIGYAENAVVFTNVPETYGQLFRQRRRWARGMFEALRANPGIFLARRISLTFVIMNLFFPWIDFAYLFLLVPGLVAALFGYPAFAELMALFLIPLTILSNAIGFVIQREMFTQRGLRVRRNFGGFLIYAIFSQLVLSPASLAGYMSELFQLRKVWDAK
jgi:biofilm PGA synthesis N-glycosyltransferase PgaC